MCVYLRTKFQVSTIILTNFRRLNLTINDFHLTFHMGETDEHTYTPPLLSSYEGRPVIYTGCIQYQICFKKLREELQEEKKLKRY